MISSHKSNQIPCLVAFMVFPRPARPPTPPPPPPPPLLYPPSTLRYTPPTLSPSLLQNKTDA